MDTAQQEAARAAAVSSMHAQHEAQAFDLVFDNGLRETQCRAFLRACGGNVGAATAALVRQLGRDGCATLADGVTPVTVQNMRPVVAVMARRMEAE